MSSSDHESSCASAALEAIYITLTESTSFRYMGDDELNILRREALSCGLILMADELLRPHVSGCKRSHISNVLNPPRIPLTVADWREAQCCNPVNTTNGPYLIARELSNPHICGRKFRE